MPPNWTIERIVWLAVGILLIILLLMIIFDVGPFDLNIGEEDRR